MQENAVNTQEIEQKTEQKNIILWDWFSMTSKLDTYQEIIRIIGLDYEGINWVSASGMHGYKDRLYFNGISVHFNGNGSVWLEMSGQGCRAFEQYSLHKDWNKLFSIILNDSQHYNLTRLDVAYDDWAGLLDINKMCKECEKNNLVTKFRQYGCERSFTKEDITIYFGSKKSDVLFRCYNKAAERGKQDTVEHWVRFEMQLRDSYGVKFLTEFMKNNSIGLTFCGVLNNYLRFVVPSETETNVTRLRSCRWWSAFVGDCNKISLFTKKETDYNLFFLSQYVFNMAGNAIDTYIQIKGIDDFQKSLKSRKTALSEKYRRLISDSKLANEIIDNSNDILDVLQNAESCGLLGR